MTSKVLIGADPELFVTKAGVGNISAHELIGGTKKNPLKVKHGAVQVDGTALEFNIEPASTSKEFLFNIQMVMNQLSTMVKDKDSTIDFDIKPAVIYRKDVFDSIPEEAKELGCEPDYNAYTKTANPRPDSSTLQGDKARMRTASGHIHIGWTEGADPFSLEHFEDCCYLTRRLDATIAQASQYWDRDNTRRELYGKLGAFRPKSYGMEYRVLSNEWLKHPQIIEWLFNTVTKLTQAALTGKLGDNIRGDSISWGINEVNYAAYSSKYFGEVPRIKGLESSNRSDIHYYYTVNRGKTLPLVGVI